jgi:hypothetical protein
MAGKYDQKLSTLRARRAPTQSTTKSDLLKSAFESIAVDGGPESYETKGKGSATTYALGCMEQMKPNYTEISLRDGKRVSEQLEKGLSVNVETRLQGSVPLNIHIFASSDVDLLVLATDFITYDTPTLSPSLYVPNPAIQPVERLRDLRNQCETLLQTKYPAADVDTSGAKSIAVSGGSLARKVDVVPAHWHDNLEYQKTRREASRGVAIFDKTNLCTIKNLPFLHMERINVKDEVAKGNAKRAIRLLKCLSRDSSQDIQLSSYDLAALIYNMEDADLTVPWYQPLQLLTNVEQFLASLVTHSWWAKTLDTPDKTRKVLDKEEKFASLSTLRSDLEDLIFAIGEEYVSELPYYSDKALAKERAKRALKEAVLT